LINYINGIKNIPHGTVGNETKEIYKKLKNILQKQHNMKINISPKVDSKSQRRVQCSIPKVDIILELFPQIIISRTSESIIRNVKITSIINSGPRQRKSKLQLISK
jgi:homoserine dehydrogenase